MFAFLLLSLLNYIIFHGLIRCSTHSTLFLLVMMDLIGKRFDPSEIETSNTTIESREAQLQVCEWAICNRPIRIHWKHQE